MLLLLLTLPLALTGPAWALPPAVATCAASGTQRDLLGLCVYPNDTQTSHGIDPGVDPTVHDIPMIRTAAGWEPEGVHLTLWSNDSVLVSWQTGEPRTAPASSPPQPHNASEVAGLVRWGTAPGQLASVAEGGVDTTYTYSYEEAAGGFMYQSPILHHVLLKGLAPGQTYWYKVGGRHPNGTATPYSRQFSFSMPAAPPAELRIGVIGDPGQTYNTSTVLRQLAASKPDVVLILGDLSYADLYLSNQTDDRWSFPSTPSSQQLRWDAFARLTEPLLASVPGVYLGGNHEVEPQALAGGATFTAFNARYPGPQDPSSIVTAPNNASHYLNASNPRQFVNTSDYEPRNAYFSLDLPWMKVLVLNNYVRLPYDPASRQYHFAAAELAGVDRAATPWLVVLLHGAPRTSYATDYGPVWLELDEWMSFYEPLLYQAQVDLVLSGHVHAYERSLPLFNFSVDPCGPAYIVVGNGGNAEGPEGHFVDEVPPPYCANASLYRQPSYQPTTSGQPTFLYWERPFCPVSQPAWSAFREPSFGHALLIVRNGTTAQWAWKRTQDGGVVVADSVTLQRATECTTNHGQEQAASGGTAVPAPVLAVVAATAAAAAVTADE